MARKIVLISCVKTKLPVRARARDLYISPLFKKSLAYAESFRPDAIYILSAKYGLVELDEEIDPYELTLKGMPAIMRREWGERVAGALGRRADLKADHFIILAGEAYREFLVPHLASYEVPMQGLDFGSQLRFLNRQVELRKGASHG